MFDNKEILEFLREKLRLLHRIFDNTVCQTQVIESEDEQKLQQLLDEREQLMKAVDQIDKAIHAEDFGESNHTEFKLVMQDIHNKLAEIQTTNTQNQLKAQSLKEKFSSRINQMNTGKNALVNGYFKTQNQVYGYYIDQKIGK